MRIIKKIALFLALNILAAVCLQFMLSSPVQYPILYEQCKEGEYNTLILGHSFAERGLDPEQLQLEEGDRAFNMCIGGAPFHNIYYQLRDLHEAHPLKRVFLDIYWPYWTNSLYSANYIDFDFQLFRMMSPAARWEFAREELLYENYNKTCFPYKLDNHALENVKDLPRIAELKLDPRYRSGSPEILLEMNDPETSRYMGNGFFYLTGYADQLEADYKFWHFEPADISDQALEDFDRIAEYCHENGIELYCVETALLPFRLQNENHGESHDYFAQFFASRDVHYVDMNYVKYELLPRDCRNYVDTDGHMNGEMAGRHSALLREIIQSEDPDSYFEKSYQDVLAGIADYEAGKSGS